MIGSANGEEERVRDRMIGYRQDHVSNQSNDFPASVHDLEVKQLTKRLFEGLKKRRWQAGQSTDGKHSVGNLVEGR